MGKNNKALKDGKLLKNLVGVREYAEKFPENSGMRWVAERMKIALKILMPVEKDTGKTGDKKDGNGGGSETT